MHSKVKKALVLAAVCSVVAMTVWPGCVTPPLPTSRKPIAARKKQDFAFVKSRHPGRSEIVTTLGEPDVYFEDLRVACYRVNAVTRRKLWLFLGLIPIGVSRIGGQVDVAFIQFDDQDRAQQFAITTASHGVHLDQSPVGPVSIVVHYNSPISEHERNGFYSAAKQWLAAKDKEQRSL
jgi:hypothetical protein